MAYNGGFPVNYGYVQPQYTIPQAQPVQAPQQAQNGIIWVQGIAGAKSYLVAPNTTVQLWDSEAQTIYLKSADASGMPTMKIIDYTIREQAQNGHTMPTLMQDGHAEYVTKDELTAFKDEIMKMIKEDDDDGKSAF